MQNTFKNNVICVLRCADLSGISEQLDKPGVKKITEILQAAKSSYVNPFNKLSGQIKVRVTSFTRLLNGKLKQFT